MEPDKEKRIQLDEFAKAALVCLSWWPANRDKFEAADIARLSYDIAVEMLKESDLRASN